MKKTLFLMMTVVLASAVVFCGCKRPQKGGKGAPPAAKSGATPKRPAQPQAPRPAERPGMVTEVQNTVDGMAGGAAFRAGQKAKAKIQDINAKHNRQLDAELGK